MGWRGFNDKEQRVLGALIAFWFAFLAGGVMLILPQPLFDGFEAFGLPAWLGQGLIAMIAASMTGALVIGAISIVSIIRAISPSEYKAGEEAHGADGASDPLMPREANDANDAIVGDLVGLAATGPAPLKSEERDYLDTSQDLRPAWLKVEDERFEPTAPAEPAEDVAISPQAPLSEAEELMARLNAFAEIGATETSMSTDGANSAAQTGDATADALLLRLATALDERERLRTVEQLRRFRDSALRQPAGASLSDPENRLREALQRVGTTDSR